MFLRFLCVSNFNEVLIIIRTKIIKKVYKLQFDYFFFNKCTESLWNIKYE